MTEQEQVLDMARIMCATCLSEVDHCPLHGPCEAIKRDAQALYNAGYRKEVINENRR